MQALQKVYYSLQQQKVNCVKHITTITELVVVRSICSTYTCAVKSNLVATVTRATLCHRCCKEL